eukprot:TRINITY_DN9978_c0_g1_i1.p1 TRINITY_DN9978_c0_g1~~TRINITY_DN9978_c0_g1_i1.p1  ORF type:complete len:480 (+),score=61.67 TRINITY_DN9978_c0_g1_i1:32-1471(+)
MQQKAIIVCLLLLIQALAALSQIQIGLERRRITSEFLQRRKRDAILPLGGGAASVGMYFTQITIGGTVFRVAVDTGSSNLYLSLPDCKVQGTDIPCPVISGRYDPTKSRNVTYPACSTGSGSACVSCKDYAGGSRCAIETLYGDGSAAYAIAVRDTVFVGSGSKTAWANANFGAMYATAGPFATDQTDGLLGLAYSNLGNLPGLIDAFVANGQPDIFSMCLNEQGGALVIGGVNTAYQTTSPLYTAIIEQLYYSVSLGSVSVAGTAVSGIPNNAKVMVDTGTTLFLLPRSQYASFKSTYLSKADCNLPGMGCDGAKENSIWDTSVCWYLNAQTLARYPTVTLTFPAVAGQGQPVTLTLSPSHYFLLVDGDKGPCRVMGIDEGDITNPIIGATILQNYNVIFDRANRRVGFAPVSTACNLDIAFVPQPPFYRGLPITQGLSPTAVTLIVVFAIILFLACAGIAFFIIMRARRNRPNLGPM